MASAKLAKRMERKSQKVMAQAKKLGWAIASMKVMTVPTRTTNITGFLTCTRGSSLRKEPPRARTRICRSNRLRAWATPWATVLGVPSGTGGAGARPAPDAPGWFILFVSI
jgi:hypothetical protein